MEEVFEMCIGKGCDRICEYEYPQPHNYISYVAKRPLDEKSRFEIISIFKKPGKSDENEDFMGEIEDYVDKENPLHPTILRYNKDNDFGVLNFSTPFIPGVTLETLVSTLNRHNKKLSPYSIARLGIGIAYSLSCLHKKHSTHRALSPEKILIDVNFQPHILGTEIASGRNQTTNNYGLLAYSAPGNKRGDYSTGTDVYSFGCLLFYMVTGHDPFDYITGKDKSKDEKRKGKDDKEKKHKGKDEEGDKEKPEKEKKHKDKDDEKKKKEEEEKSKRDATEIQGLIDTYEYDKRFVEESEIKKYFSGRKEYLHKLIGFCWERDEGKRYTALNAVNFLKGFAATFDDDKKKKYEQYFSEFVDKEAGQFIPGLLEDNFVDKDFPAKYSFNQCLIDNVFMAIQLGFHKTKADDKMERIMKLIAEKEFQPYLSNPMAINSFYDAIKLFMKED